MGIASALQGYLLATLNWILRIVMAVGGLLMIVPGIVTDLIGLALIVVVVVFQLAEKKKVSAVK